MANIPAAVIVLAILCTQLALADELGRVLRNAYVDDGGDPTVQAFRIVLDYAIPLF